MLIFDAHLDMAWNACEWNRDLALTVEEIRKFEQHLVEGYPGPCTVSWPELTRGNVGVIIATLLPRLNRKSPQLLYHNSPAASYAASIGQLAYYRILQQEGTIRHLWNGEELSNHVNDWNQYLTRLEADCSTETEHAPPIGFILSMEGSWSILSPDQISEWFDAGLRILGPAHYGEDPYCHGTGSEGGLKERGPALLRKMQEVGMLLDATHLSDQSFWEAMDIYEGPVLASHHNCRALVPGDRQLTDDQIKELLKRDAVIGAVMDCWMIQPGYIPKVSDARKVSLSMLVDHIDHICQLAGNAKHCGIGSDLDGGFGKEQTPNELETIADMKILADFLSDRSYSDEDIRGIMSQNWIDFFMRAWS